MNAITKRKRTTKARTKAKRATTTGTTKPEGRKVWKGPRNKAERADFLKRLRFAADVGKATIKRLAMDGEPANADSKPSIRADALGEVQRARRVAEAKTAKRVQGVNAMATLMHDTDAKCEAAMDYRAQHPATTWGAAAKKFGVSVRSIRRRRGGK